MIEVANRYHLFIMMFMGTLVEDQQFSGPIPEELGKLEKLNVFANGRLSISFCYQLYVAVINK